MALVWAAARWRYAVVAAGLVAIPPAPTAEVARVQGSAGQAADLRSDGYVGSSACRGCHTYLYDRWRETRHARAILSAAAARAAGYPLPLRRARGARLMIHAWADVVWVFGGKQRVAYIARNGHVADSAYHHRLGTWRSFPDAPLARCARCHATAARSKGPGPLDVAWSEPAVGCEACHGPGAAHVRSLAARDISRNPSSRVCGRCHTLTGAVLPRDERHLTHDLVQVWHADAHATGVRRNSHNAFCARCHSPFEARGGDAGEAAARPVWSEAEHGITCIGCHDPHHTTSAAYSRARFVAGPPQVARHHVHTGNDQDFTSVDYAEYPNTDAVCRTCHRGADRVTLDHANARCNDCHVSYRRLRKRSSRVLHDANRPSLACRPCHEDAEHRLSLLYASAGFLDAANVHDLRRLPRAARRHAPLSASLPPLLRPVRSGSPLPIAPGSLPTRRTVTSAPGVNTGREETLRRSGEPRVEVLLGAARDALRRGDGATGRRGGGCGPGERGQLAR